MPTVYFDNAATTPLDPRVRAAMLPYFGETFGNPSSMHWAGRVARAAVDKARAQVAALLNASPSEIVFVASGTEADNLALIGAAAGLPPKRRHIVASRIEHPAILKTCRHLETLGFSVRYLPVTSDGIVLPETLRDAITPQTGLVSVMTANNVLGTLQPIAELGAVAHAHGALFHTDAVQAAGKIPLDLQALPVDLLSLSAHKFYGPKGVGALYVHEGVKLSPIVFGGGQERGLRSATENVAGIVGLGAAAEIAAREMPDDAVRLVALRERIIAGVEAAIPNAYLIGHRYQRLPTHIALGFAGQEGEAIKLLLALDEAGIAVSAGSACSASARAEPSYILSALGFDPFRARGAIRITLGRFNTDADVDYLLEVLVGVVATLRPITSLGSTLYAKASS
jgi:cysteine desulfurase